MSYCYEYPRPMVSTDILLFGKQGNELFILLIKRLNEPFKNRWALPGGFVEENEALKNAALRELEEETGLNSLQLHQFHAFGDPGRDPRGHCVTVVYYGFVDKNQVQSKAGDDAKETGWFKLSELPELAFDHEKVIQQAVEELLHGVVKDIE